MTETLNRDELIVLLNRLGGDADEEVLEAARQVHARVTDAGMRWEDLLAAEELADESDEADDQEFETPDDEAPAERAEKNADSLRLIGELLARSDISEELRSELEGYKTDIAEGEFVEGDRRYLRAMHGRLTGRS